MVFIEKNELKVGIFLNIYCSKESFLLCLKKRAYKWVSVVLGILSDFLTIFFEGIITISSRLNKVYKRFNKQCINIPILCNGLKTFNPEKPYSNDFKIGYFGNISENKDGAFSIILAIMEYNFEEKDKVFLDIYGTGDKESLIKLQKDILESEFINYLGKINQEDVYNMLPKYDLLLAIRPRNIQTNYGFSTKLAEYLSSGIPVLATDISDNAMYIKDGENGFIMKSEKKINYIQIKNKLKEIKMYTPQKLSHIGLQGSILCRESFNSLDYSNLLYSFFFKGML